ncbi:uncharacterized protein G2W53_001831 [Senna tora]|uniref:Uncharacterized protein n=1 Tax=Senna tora TaxID=362788 RepID=A0A834XJD8_9FABA|nr:uncharacterized protein G2W53_001831 [Senna tora]
MTGENHRKPRNPRTIGWFKSCGKIDKP